MPTAVQSIPRVQIGGTSLVSAEYANQIIDAVNGVRSARIAPIAGVGKFSVTKSDFILDLSDLDERVRTLETGAGTANLVYNANGVLTSNTVIVGNTALGNFRLVNGTMRLDLTPINNRMTVVENVRAIINVANVITNSENIANFRVVANTPFSNFLLDFTALHNRLANIESRLTNTIAAINNANISANCNANTNAITVTLTFPNVPVS